MRTAKKIKCTACGKRIHDHETDLVLWRLGSSERRYYHTRCGSAVYKRILGENPDVWRLTVRHAAVEAN